MKQLHIALSHENKAQNKRTEKRNDAYSKPPFSG
jgi:hypothetical protein